VDDEDTFVPAARTLELQGKCSVRGNSVLYRHSEGLFFNMGLMEIERFGQDTRFQWEETSRSCSGILSWMLPNEKLRSNYRQEFWYLNQVQVDMLTSDEPYVQANNSPAFNWVFFTHCLLSPSESTLPYSPCSGRNYPCNQDQSPPRPPVNFSPSQ
jgi:hypothetical protein